MTLGHGRAYSNLPIPTKIKFTLVIVSVFREQPIKKSGRERITSLKVWFEEKH